MSRPLLVLRPEPGATETAARARALGIETIVVPLFEILRLDWHAPDPAGFDALMVTSANAVRNAGLQLASYVKLPVHAVGTATADSLRAARFADVHTGPGDAAGLIAQLVENRVSRVLHLCGEDRREPGSQGISITRIAVYAARSVADPPGLAAALGRAPVAMLHSPRAAARFAALTGDRGAIALAAISRNVAEAACAGWEAIGIAATPDDEALLEIAVRMCELGPTI